MNICLRHLLLRLCCWLCWLPAGAVWAQPVQPLQLIDSQGEVEAWPALTVLSDATGLWQVEDVQRRQADLRAPSGARANLGVRRDAVWLHVALEVPVRRARPVVARHRLPVARPRRGLSLHRGPTAAVRARRRRPAVSPATAAGAHPRGGARPATGVAPRAVAARADDQLDGAADQPDDGGALQPARSHLCSCCRAFSSASACAC